MRIGNSTSPLFKAKYINYTEIRKKDFYPNYLRKQASFIQIEPENDYDINALEDISNYWTAGGFAKNIYYMACAIRNKSKFYKNHKVYALTSQKEDFEKPDSRKFLGIIGICQENENKTFIEYIQANPEIIYSREPEFKGIGTAIMDSLKNLCEKIYCYPSQTKSVIDFYLKNGFVKKPDTLNHYFWEK